MKSQVVKVLVLSFFAFGFLICVPGLHAEHKAGSLKILEEIESGFVALAKHTQPAVINLSPFVPKSPSVRRQGTGRKGKPASAGAGVIIDSENGYAVTNHHVVKGSDTIQVTLYGGKKVLGKVIGSDEDTDLAVIKIETDEKLASVKLGDSSKVKTGQLVVAIGNPYGLNDTFSLGIVSGLNRENVNISRYEDFIQTDASINPGNSGGPLLNVKGEVIGINTAIINYAQSIGFSIPSNIVKRVVSQLIDYGEVRRGWLGVGIDFVPDDVADKAKIEQGTGVLVNSVFEGQPAHEVGVLVGDIILKIGGSKVNSPSSMIRLIGSITPGQIVQLDILRDGERKLFDLQLGKREASTKVASLVPESSNNFLGFNIDESEGNGSRIVVSEISSGSQAEIKGLKVGDSISAVNGENLENKAQFKEIIDRLSRGKPIFLLVIRDKEKIRLVLNE
jgi:serine protease Do